MEPLYRSRPGGFDIQPAQQPRATRINDFIYVSERFSNSFLVLTDDGRVVINTGMGFEAPVHERNYDTISTAPTRYILLTQGHVDHVGGVDFLRQPGTGVVAQANNQYQQADDARLLPFRATRSGFAFAESVGKGFANSAREFGTLPSQARPEPTITLDDHYTFDLGGVRFELLATPGGETTDSMVIWDTRKRGYVQLRLSGHTCGTTGRCAIGRIPFSLPGRRPKLFAARRRSAKEGRSEFNRILLRVSASEDKFRTAQRGNRGLAWRIVLVCCRVNIPGLGPLSRSTCCSGRTRPNPANSSCGAATSICSAAFSNRLGWRWSRSYRPPAPRPEHSRSTSGAS